MGRVTLMARHERETEFTTLKAKCERGQIYQTNLEPFYISERLGCLVTILYFLIDPFEITPFFSFSLHRTSSPDTFTSQFLTACLKKTECNRNFILVPFQFPFFGLPIRKPRHLFRLFTQPSSLPCQTSLTSLMSSLIFQRSSILLFCRNRCFVRSKTIRGYVKMCQKTVAHCVGIRDSCFIFLYNYFQSLLD